jgi:hypothetical protein
VVSEEMYSARVWFFETAPFIPVCVGGQYCGMMYIALPQLLGRGNDFISYESKLVNYFPKIIALCHV